jgi:hypothetical protein
MVGGIPNPNSSSKSIEETVQVENVTTGNRPNWSRDQEQQTVIEIDSLRAIDKCPNQLTRASKLQCLPDIVRNRIN